MLAQQAGAVAFAPPRDALTEPDRATVARLREELRTLKRERAVLRRRFSPTGSLPKALALTPTETSLVAVLLANDHCSHELLFSALFSDRPEEDQPDDKITDILIFKAREKLRRFGMNLETYRGFGFSMRPESKAKMLMLMRAEAAETARPLSAFAAVDLRTFPYQVPRFRRAATSGVDSTRRG
jgi:two-component system cell cycle response regulator CtrA